MNELIKLIDMAMNFRAPQQPPYFQQSQSQPFAQMHPPGLNNQALNPGSSISAINRPPVPATLGSVNSAFSGVRSPLSQQQFPSPTPPNLWNQQQQIHTKQPMLQGANAIPSSGMGTFNGGDYSQRPAPFQQYQPSYSVPPSLPQQQTFLPPQPSMAPYQQPISAALPPQGPATAVSPATSNFGGPMVNGVMSPPYMPSQPPLNQSSQPAYQYQNQQFHPSQQQHFEKRSVNLLQERNILPPTPIDPPHIRLPHMFEHKDVNCSPDIFRCTLTAIPQTQELLKKARLPLGLVIHPFKDMKQLSVLQSSVIVRCRACRTYINPFVSFPDQRHWKCNVCSRTNDLPEEFHFDPATKTYGEPSRRPEIKNATVEFIAPSEYMPVRKNLENVNEVRQPQPAAYIFLLDVTAAAIESGYLEEFCSRLIDNIDHIPGDHRTLMGFMAVDSQIHYFLLRDDLPPKELIVNDIEESFVPWNDELLVKFHEKKEIIKQFLEQLPTIFSHNKDTSCALGAALTAAHSILADVGGRITVFQASLADLNPGALTSREDPNLRASKEITNLGPAIDFYKKLSLEACSHQVAMDLFLLSSTYADMATLSEMAKFCGGCIHYYPGLHAIRNAWELERFSCDLDRYLSRKIGWEAVLRIRCTKGLSLHTFHGSFFVRSTDLLALANINPDAAFGVQMQMDENLNEHTTVTFQAALLYTSSKGERRIRVHTLCLPVTTSLADIQQGADIQTVMSMLAKMAVDRSVNGSVSDAREALVNACVDALGSYSSSFAASQKVGALLAPESLKLFPLYILGLLKHPAFAYGTSIKLDHRVFAMNSFKTLPHYYLMLQIYPNLYPLHLLDDQNSQLPLLQLSYEKIDRHGAYLMDTGTHLFLYLCQAISDTYCQNVFGVSAFSRIDEDMTKLPEMNNFQSEAVRKFIDTLRSNRPFYSPLRIIREDSSNKEVFVRRLVDDRSESSFSYVEFLQHLHKELNPK